MIVEPVPTTPRSPIRRAASAAGLALPAVALVLVIGGAVLGQANETRGPAASGAAGLAAADASAGPPTPSGSPDALAAVAVRFPTEVATLPVRTVTATLDGRRSDGLHGLVAVSGYLIVPALPIACADSYLGPPGELCARRAMLADAPAASSADGPNFLAMGPHLHPQVPTGVRLPHEVAEGPDGALAPPLAVVVVGRLDDPRAAPCTPGGGCDEGLVLESVAWVAGDDSPLTVVVDPELAVDRFDDSWRVRRAVARSALGRDLPELLTAYVRPAMLGEIDPAAASSLDRVAGDPPPAVWYVRGLEPDGDAPSIRWVVVDDATGIVIASGDDPTLPSG